MNSLFRKEVLAAKRPASMGTISLAQPMPLWYLTALAAFITAIVIVFLTLGTYSSHTRITGELVPTGGLAVVAAPASGVLTRLDAKEGDLVTAGQVLGVLTIPTSTIAGSSAAGELAGEIDERIDGLEQAHQAELDLLALEEVRLGKALRSATLELRQIEHQLRIGKQQVSLAEETLSQLEQLRQGDYVSDLQLKQHQAASLDKLGQVQSLMRQEIDARRRIEEVQIGLDELPAKRRSLIAAQRSEQAALEQERIRVGLGGELSIVAPISGRVASRSLKPGQSIQVGQGLLAIMPRDGVLEAEFLVSSSAIGSIEDGDKVLLRYAAYPYQRYGHFPGWVRSVSRGPVGHAADGESERNSRYRVTVALVEQSIRGKGVAEPLRPGLHVEADVLGEERTLLQWILEPVLSMRRTI